MRRVSELDNTGSGTCYLIGKGSTINHYEFDESIPRIGINDVAVVIDCDYAVVGTDINNHKWLDASMLYNRLPTCIPEMLYRYPKAYKYKPMPIAAQALDENNLFRDTSRAASMGMGLAKRVGFTKVIAVGFGDPGYAYPWNSNSEERFALNIDHDSVKHRVVNDIKCQKHRKWLKGVGEKLEMELEIV